MQNAVPPPESVTDRGSGFGSSRRAVDSPGHSFITSAQQPPKATSSYSNIGKKRTFDDDDYFYDNDAPNTHLQGDYLPSENSPTNNQADSEDELDSYMASIDAEVVKQQDKSFDQPKKKVSKGVRDDIEEEDDQDTYFRFVDEHPELFDQDEEVLNKQVEYDRDGNAIIPSKFKIIDPLPPVNHSSISYASFSKSFYHPHEQIRLLSSTEALELRRTLKIQVSGFSSPKPVSSFAHFNFDEKLMTLIRKYGFTSPTPIQSQGIPIVASGRDCVGIAKTGSGKTVTYLWPLIPHILAQPEMSPHNGPIGLICVPTRELAQQVFTECKKFCKPFNIGVVCAFGGGSMWQQINECADSPEIIVCTPGRIIDLIKKKATNFLRVTYLVFDEADRMFDLGFEAQVRSIANHIRPDRQTLLFSATFKRKIERLCRDVLNDPIKVVQGDLGEVNEDISQEALVLADGEAKWRWMSERIVEFQTRGSLLIFITKKVDCELFAERLRRIDLANQFGVIHGDMHQSERNNVIAGFKKQSFSILVATDVAARGLDIAHIRTVINYDVARDIDTHVHRVGRTGRAGVKGHAITLLTSKDTDFAAHLVRNFEMCGAAVSDDLLNLALRNTWFKNQREKGIGGAGEQQHVAFSSLGKGRSRMGLGASTFFKEDQDDAKTGNGKTFAPIGEPADGLQAKANQLVANAQAKAEKSRGPLAQEKTDRIGTLRNCFKNQFKSAFTAASLPDGPAKSTITATEVELERKNERRKKSRWDK